MAGTNFMFNETQVDQEDYMVHDHRENSHCLDTAPDITNVLHESMTFPETQTYGADSGMNSPATPIRVAAAALAVPTTPISRVQVTYNSPADDLMPLIIAANDVKLNYKAMAAMDPHGRSASALEHRVRNFRHAAKALAAAAKEKENGSANDKANGTIRENGIADGDADKKKSTPARKTPAKASPRGKKAATAKETEVIGQDDSTPSKKPKVPRKRQLKVEAAEESVPVKKRKTTKKNQVEAKEDGSASIE